MARINIKFSTHDMHSKKAQAFLAMVLFIGGIMIIMGITMALVVATFVDSGYGAQAGNNAEAAATGGVEDAFLNLIRNSTFASGGYAVSSGNYSANVTVTQNSPSTGLVTVLSLATVNSRTRKVQAVFSIAPVTGQASLVSWGDVQ